MKHKISRRKLPHFPNSTARYLHKAPPATAIFWNKMLRFCLSNVPYVSLFSSKIQISSFEWREKTAISCGSLSIHHQFYFGLIRSIKSKAQSIKQMTTIDELYDYNSRYDRCRSIITANAYHRFSYNSAVMTIGFLPLEPFHGPLDRKGQSKLKNRRNIHVFMFMQCVQLSVQVPTMTVKLAAWLVLILGSHAYNFLV